MWNVPTDANDSRERLLCGNRPNLAKGRGPETRGANALYNRTSRISVQLP